MKKRGQITIFVIIAVLVVAAAVLFYLAYPQIRASFGGETQSPEQTLNACISAPLTERLTTIGLQGGSMNPQFAFTFPDGTKTEYLCYTYEFYKTCSVQQPLLKEHIERELKSAISSTVSGCVDELKQNLESQGYEVSIRNKDFTLELYPQNVIINLTSPILLRKADTQTNLPSVTILIRNNLYELVSIAESIINYEAELGDSETTIYMNYYPNLKVEKVKQSDGTKIYTLTNRESNQQFRFASRSLSWPPGYGTEGALI